MRSRRNPHSYTLGLLTSTGVFHLTIRWGTSTGQGALCHLPELKGTSGRNR